MLSVQFIRENADRVRECARNKGVPEAPVDRIIELDDSRKRLIQEVETRQAEQNRLSKAVGPLIGRAKAEGRALDEISEVARLEALKSEIRGLEESRAEVEKSLETALYEVPNVYDDSVPIGADESGNVELRLVGEKPTFAFTPRPHYDLAEALGIMDFERAVRVAGSRFSFLVGAGARLERALVQFLLDRLTRERGYVEVAPPFLVNSASMYGTANLPKFGDDAFHVEKQDLWLIPTAEVPVTNMYGGEILEGSRLPVRHAAFSPCFRSEAGSAGKDTRGYIRMHQFNKVEMVRFTTPETSADEHEAMTADAEHMLQALGLHYRVLLMCSGDMGFAQYKKYDLEAWAPGLGKYLEVSSCSNFQEFQSRRANLRYRPEPGARPRFLHTLNGSALGVMRTVSVILETYQREDGSIEVPAVLRPYMGGQEVISAA